MLCRIAFCWVVLIGLSVADTSAGPVEVTAGMLQQDRNAANEPAVRMAIADAAARPDGVRLTTTWSPPTINQGDTIVNTLDVYNAVAGQKVRIQNSNHGASHFTTRFGAAV